MTPAVRPGRAGLALLAFTFFGAGAVGLVFEVVWVRTLSLVLGASNYAISTVLAVYMAGLALGGFIFGRWLGVGLRTPQQIHRCYTVLLAGIGISALPATLLTPWLGSLLGVALGAVGWNSWPAVGLRALFGLLLLAVPATLLGGLVPVAAQLTVEDSGSLGARLGWLYFVNTLGAVAGALLAGFVLLERVGIRGTALLAAGAAVLFAFLSRLVAPAVRTDSRGPPADRRQARTPLIVAYGLSGFAALGYEVVWARALTTILGQPVYGFTIVTATFLAGLAIGSYVGGRLADRWRDPQLGFATIELLLSLAAFLPTALLALATRTLVGNLVAAAHGVWFLRTALLAGFCFMLMLIPAVLAGATFPVACRVLLPRRGAVGPGVGRLCAANSFGALAGSLVSGFLLIPWLGTIGTNIALAVVSFAAAVVVVAGARHRSLPRLGMAAAFGVVFVLVAAFVAPRRLRILPPDVASAPGAWRVLHYDETGEGVVTTAEGRSGDRQTWVNSSVVCGTALPALKPVRVMGLLPFALLDCPADILVIGYGLGVTASLLTALSPRSVDCVEICPGVVAASQAFADWNNRVYASPNLRLMAGDGRNYLLCTNRTYDVISCDPTHPALGSGALYTADFYRLCRRRLKPGGILTLYLPLHKLTGRDFRGLLATFRQAFPDCALWFGIAHGVLVGRRDAPLRLDYRRLAGLFARMPQTVRDALADVFIDTPAQFCGLCLLGPAGMARASVGGGLVTDDRPAVEFAGSRTSDTRTWSANAQAVTSAWTGPADVVVNAGADSLPVMSASLAAAERFRATTAAARGDRPSQAAAFAQALMYDPADREAALFLQMSAPRQ